MSATTDDLLVPLGVESEMPPGREARLLRFYDRLRARVVEATRGRSPLARGTVEVLLLAPDVFVLLLRLALDREVPAASRRLFAAALAYYLLPVDLLPEAFVGGAGFLDDVVLGAAVLSHALGDDLEAIAARSWSGSHELRRTLRDVLASAEALLGVDLWARVRCLLASRGIEVA